MGKEVLQKNIMRLIKDNGYSIAEVERMAKIQKNRVFNLIKGITTNPSQKLLESIAKFFKMTVSDLYKDQLNKGIPVTDDDLSLMMDIMQNIITEIKNSNIKFFSHQIIHIFDDVYLYTKHAQSTKADVTYIKWALKQHSSNQFDV